MKKTEPSTKETEATTKKTEPTMTKTEPTTKMTEAKEEGAAPRHIRVVYSNKKCKIIISVVSVLVFLTICAAGFIGYLAAQPRVPKFILEDLYVDSLSNSSVMVKLSSTNKNSNITVYYSKMSLHVRVLDNFETKNVFLESTVQKPREVATWTAVVANNNDNVKPTGAFLVRYGNATGEVIVDIMIQWKSWFSYPKFGFRIKCPVMLRLEDLSSAITKPMSTCSHHLRRL